MAKRKALEASMPTAAEMTSRFYELVIKYCLDNGKRVELNLDLLRETKSDPRVGAMILQEVRILEKI